MTDAKIPNTDKKDKEDITINEPTWKSGLMFSGHFTVS